MATAKCVCACPLRLFVQTEKGMFVGWYLSNLKIILKAARFYCQRPQQKKNEYLRKCCKLLFSWHGRCSHGVHNPKSRFSSFVTFVNIHRKKEQDFIRNVYIFRLWFVRAVRFPVKLQNGKWNYGRQNGRTEAQIKFHNHIFKISMD